MILVEDFLRDQQVLAAPDAPASPTVSIILPTYRRFKEGLLQRAIRSVLAQSYPDFELLVMDDGSSDGSAGLVTQMRQSDARIVHVRHELNSGLPALRVNEGIELARGRYIAFQFDDDVWRPDALATLVAAAERQPGPAVIVGRAQVNSKPGQSVIPTLTPDLVSLTERNRFANNSVLLDRTIFDTYGLYDPHIGMRRLTDWDLWLRLIRHLPFIPLDQIVADVYESTAGAIGLTTPWDVDLFRFIHSIPRDSLLTLANWRSYAVDALQIGATAIPGAFRRRLYEQQIVPFYFQKRHALPALGGFSATLDESPPQTMLYTQQSYEVSNEVALARYDALANQRGSFKSYYQTLDEIRAGWSQQVDLALLIRTVQDQAVEMLAEAEQSACPLGLYLDDDLFTFHEYGPQFNYMAPGSHYYDNLTQIAAHADVTLVTNEYIGASARAFTPRVVPHNGAIPDDALPQHLPARGEPLRIGYVGSGYRIDEFRAIWDALQRLSQEYGQRLVFEFWGMDISSLPKLASPTITRPYTFSYPLYLRELQAARFDVLLIPLFDQPRPRLAKALIKYYETAAAGALGIFSDVPQYAALPGGLTCLKTANDAAGWYAALKQALDMPAEAFDALRRRCIAHVREEFTTSAQINLHEAALRALQLHARTRAKRYTDGCPRVLYVLHSVHFGGAEIQLWRRLRLARRYGIQPVVVIPLALRDSEQGLKLKQALALEGIELEAAAFTCFTEPRSPSEFFSELERGQLRQLIERLNPALVHSVTFIPSLGQVCQEMNLPHVTTLYAVEDDFAWSAGRPDFRHCSLVQSDCLRYADRWSRLLGVPKLVARDMAPDSLFRQGQRRYLQALQPDGMLDPAPRANPRPHMIVMGTFQPRKQQLETIQAAARLKAEGLDFRLTLYGYTQFYADYVQQCRQAIQAGGLEAHVAIQDFSEDLERLVEDADMLLSLSNYESFPGSIKDAFAAGLLVVATPAGGVRELVIDGVSGIVCAAFGVADLADGMRRALALTPAERWRIAEQGRHIAWLELHPQRAANDLLRMYNLALDQTQSRLAPAAAVRSTIVLPDPNRSERGRVRQPLGESLSLMPIGAGVRYALTVERDHWMGVDVLVEPFTRPVSGQLCLRVFSAAGNLLRQVNLDIAHLREGSWLELRFDALTNSAGRTFWLEFSLVGGARRQVISLRQSSPPRRRELRLLYRLLRQLGRRLPGGALHCRVWYTH